MRPRAGRKINPDSRQQVRAREVGTVRVSVVLDVEQRARLRQIAEAEGLSEADLVRRAVRAYCQRYEETGTI